MANNIIPIKYTSRDYETIRRDLIEHAKRYYPDSFKDFNEGSFGSLMLDTVSYVGDILSFYLDYQANESFLETATDFNNILKIAKQMGYKFTNIGSSTGVASFYISVPADSLSLGPNTDYLPILKKGSTFSTMDNTKFILNEDVRFDLTTLDYTPDTVTDAANSYIVKAYGTVISGIIGTERISIADYEKFLKIRLSQGNIIEIISVLDEEGNEYYEVNNLAQNIIYKSFSNKDKETSNLASEILKPYLVPRRFTVENEINATYLQFGASSTVELKDSKSMLAEPSKAVLNVFGKNYISDTSFDPSMLTNSDKFGISPSNTNLIVTYRYLPTNRNVNYSVDSLNRVENTEFYFFNQQNLDSFLVEKVKNSLEVGNDSPIIGSVSVVDPKELKIRIKNAFSSQDRAVTAEDYKSLVYKMPTKFGSIKRVNIVRDNDSLKRNLNLYILCENKERFLTESNKVVKVNLKNWLLKSKMLNDSIDILDGKILNYGIKFVALGYNDRPKYDILSDALRQLRADFSDLPEFGETFYISKILNSLKKVDGILDVQNIIIEPKIGGNGSLVYSDSSYNFEASLSSDKRFITVPENAIMELKYPLQDIQGTII